MRHDTIGLKSRRAALRGAFFGTLLSALAFAQSAAIQSQDANISGIVAEVTECKRADGVLSVRMRLRNTSAAEVTVYLIDKNNYDSYYVTAASKKYFVLRDTENKPLAPQADGGGVSVTIAKGGQYVWWSKYPAPPNDVKKVGYFTPITPPFDNVPITD
jgi:hypothetical protein